MIQIESIAIKEFRGIRDLKLDLRSKNFAVCGPNGTGKSGVVDALEFALTGAVSRLTGEGRGDISLLAHGPHVDKRAAPEKSTVTVELTIPSLGKKVTIERNVKTPRKPSITPNTQDVLQVLQAVEAHPEVVLSRREIITYVLATPGDRAQEVQALLRLESIEKVRAGLLKIANATDREIRPLTTAESAARDNFLRALGISELTKQKVLDATNEKRTVLGLASLVELADSTSLRDGLETPTPATPQRIVKKQASTDLKHLRQLIDGLGAAEVTQEVEKVKEELTALLADPAAADAVKRERFFRAGAELVSADSCPLCDVTWDPVALRAHVADKIAHMQGIAQKGKSIDAKLIVLGDRLRAIATAAGVIRGHAKLAEPVIPSESLQQLTSSLNERASKFTVSARLADIPAALEEFGAISATAVETIGKVESYVAGLPEPTKLDAARDWLILAQERLEVLREARRRLKAGRERAERAKKISDTYVKASDDVLVALYATVEEDFVRLYRFINRDDEAAFQAKLTPSMGKLGFDVDFYGRGFFPPGAYHSEGHQDGMGLCLYLALMRRVQGDEFRFSVLDDVLMSVDSGHRREVCALLKKEFPNTQFVMTTHDKIWLRHMRTEGLTTAQSAVEFRNWTVDQGPTCWDDRDVWKEIEDALNVNDVRTAAGVLRNYLEFVSGELCHRLRARVEFRGDAQYQLGELLPAAVGQMRNLLSKGKDAANSWKQQQILDDLVARAASFGAIVDASNVERWQINVAIHFNGWENLGKADFAPVVESCRKLVEAFYCTVCNEALRVSPDREAMESVRCGCGQTNINLKKKA
ncbi:MAG: AAA family ATPase [Steroidobacteraceae bacterium]|nr:AAA family ATPase [Nevskiaceae bacterium]MCP5472289.1 AAA family ATPase [Nevskiaceae bacterium]